MRRLMVALCMLIPSMAMAQTTYYMAPLDLRQYPTSNDCEPPDDVCIATGVYLGFKNQLASTHAPQYFVGVDVNNFARGAGSINGMTGAQLFNQFDTGGTCTTIFGVDSEVFVGTPSVVTNVIHFYASDSESGGGGTIGTSYGLYYFPDTGDGAAYAVFSPQANGLIALAGRARIGDTGDPTAGYDLDVQGPLLVNGGVNLGQATSTPGATPTATSATATATAVTPTPTPTSTPKHLIKEDMALDGNVVQVGNAPRSINVGSCTKAPCAGKAQTFASGPGNGSGAGGSQDLSSGAGANFAAAGDMTRTIGTGGGSIVDTARRGLFSIGGLQKMFADFILGAAAGSTRPTFGAGCGSTASDALATNNQGRITMSGIGQTGSCVVTFGNGGFANAPVCVAQFSVDGGVAGHGIKTVVETTTTVSINNAVLATGVAQNFALNDVVKYWCVGRE